MTEVLAVGVPILVLGLLIGLRAWWVSRTPTYKYCPTCGMENATRTEVTAYDGKTGQPKAEERWLVCPLSDLEGDRHYIKRIS